MKIIILILIIFPLFSYSQNRQRLDTTDYQRVFDYSKIELPKFEYDPNDPWPTCTGNVTTIVYKKNSILFGLIKYKQKVYAKRHKNIRKY